ncbi:hypothetical protein N7462_002527 [Penicillium macrosclerotiorum]|uniref:uncharacterized protein n=1 Tax=Penicillium macrosclerotiorum TaxID=303699 RepID=UPI002546A1DD|nr:uncharacterized protein N7462_002527 [Penicillium macrosclerotiorum]KAJ5693104.1 hypothetical protein N7462_002527 [Penicillium macrosclerotiorum]
MTANPLRPVPQPSLHHSRASFEPWTGPTATTRETPTPDTLTPQHSLLHRSRRSVPSFHLPSLQHLEPSSNRNSAPVGAFPPTLLPSPDAEERPQDHLLSTRPDVKSTMPSSVAYSETRTLASEHGRAWNSAHRLGPDTRSLVDEGRPKNEDIFLNIARTDSSRRDSLGRSEFRRSRLGYSSQSLRSPTTPRADPEQTPSPDQRLSNVESPLLSQNGSPTIPSGSVTHSPTASAHPLDDPGRFRYSSLTTGSRSVIGAPRSRLSRTSPETSPRSPAVNSERRSSIHEPRLRHSTLSTIRSRQPSSSEATERIRGETEKARDGTESTLSTTAPSTVWDELDDLKSRIRKLELTGKLPPSSQEAISSMGSERPRTAATTMTGLSTSPRHHRKASNPSADAENAGQNPVHPLLQSALAKAKSVLSSDVYTALEVTITDSLTLSTMLGVNTVPSSNVSVMNGGYSSPERHARRKADSVCRSLTELCLALTDEQLKRTRSASASHVSGTQSQRMNGTQGDALRPLSSYQRSASHEPEDVDRYPTTSSRMPSRLEARRASLINPSSAVATETQPPQSPSVAPSISRLHRISTSLRSRRIPTEEEAAEAATPPSRSLSRAMTEIGTPSPAQSISPRQRFSVGHTPSRSISSAQQPQDQNIGISLRSSQYQEPPTTSQAQPAQPRTPTTSYSQTGLPFRRSYMTPAVYSPATSRSNIQAGSRRYGLSPGFSNATPGSGAEESPRSQLETSQTRISVPSGKTAASYTPIQQTRLRTNSLGARRFGLRRRSAAAPDETMNLDDSID